MWRERLMGVVYCWFGVSLAAIAVQQDGIEVTPMGLGAVLAGTLVFLWGVWLVAGNWRLPEDDGSTIVPPQWIWYLVTIGFGTSAAIRTLEVIGAIEL